MENKPIHKMRIVFGLFGILGFIGCVAIASGWCVGASSHILTFRNRVFDSPNILDWIFNLIMIGGFAYCIGAIVSMFLRKEDKGRLFYVLLTVSFMFALIPSVWSYGISWYLECAGVRELIKPLVMITVPLFASIFCFLYELTKPILNRNTR